MHRRKFRYFFNDDVLFIYSHSISFALSSRLQVEFDFLSYFTNKLVTILQYYFTTILQSRKFSALLLGYGSSSYTCECEGYGRASARALYGLGKG